MEWKKIANMEYGKIIFHSIPCPVRNVTGAADTTKKKKDKKET